jgi:hypothetical protein
MNRLRAAGDAVIATTVGITVLLTVLLSTAATAFELISDRLCYDFEVRRHDREAGAGVASRLR